MKRDEDEKKDKKFDIDICQIAKNFLPINPPEEKIQKNKSEEEYQAQTKPSLLHN